MQQFVGEKEVDASYTLEELAQYDKPHLWQFPDKASYKRAYGAWQTLNGLSWHQRHPERNRAGYHTRRMTPRARISRMLRRARQTSKDHGWECDLDPEFLISIMCEKCWMTGIVLDWCKGNVPTSAPPWERYDIPSLDRIDSNDIYRKGNVHIISWFANIAKNSNGPEFADYYIAFGRSLKTLPVKF